MKTLYSKDLYNSKFISGALKSYKTTADCHLLASVVFSNKIPRTPRKETTEESPKEDNETANKSFFWRMRFAITKGQGFVMSYEDYETIKSELGMSDFLTKELDNYDFQSRLNGLIGKWCVYYPEGVIVDNKKWVWGIVRAALIFEPFGKIKIESWDPRNNESQDYIGIYNLHEDASLIEVKAKLVTKDESLQKDLSVLFSIGARGKVSLVTGNYLNLDQFSIASGLLLADREISGSFTPKFFKETEEEFMHLPEHIRGYFASQPHAMLWSPFGVIDKPLLKEHLENMSLWSSNSDADPS